MKSVQFWPVISKELTYFVPYHCSLGIRTKFMQHFSNFVSFSASQIYKKLDTLRRWLAKLNIDFDAAPFAKH